MEETQGTQAMFVIPRPQFFIWLKSQFCIKKI